MKKTLLRDKKNVKEINPGIIQGQSHEEFKIILMRFKDKIQEILC